MIYCFKYARFFKNDERDPMERVASRVKKKKGIKKSVCTSSATRARLRTSNFQLWLLSHKLESNDEYNSFTHIFPQPPGQNGQSVTVLEPVV